MRGICLFSFVGDSGSQVYCPLHLREIAALFFALNRPAKRKYVYSAGLQKRARDVPRERRVPAERHGPQHPQRLVFHGQSQRERLVRPVQKAVVRQRVGAERQLNTADQA